MLKEVATEQTQPLVPHRNCQAHYLLAVIGVIEQANDRTGKSQTSCELHAMDRQEVDSSVNAGKHIPSPPLHDGDNIFTCCRSKQGE